MSISKLVAGLNDARLDLTAKEVADIVWLWVQIEESEELDDSPQNSAGDISTDNSLTKTNITQQKTNSSSSTATQSSTVVTQTDLYPKIVEQYIPPEKTKQLTPLQVPDAPAIANKRQIERALKSLIRKFPSAIDRELDVEKTVNRIIEKDIWTPIETPVLTRRWLDLVLVVEVNNSLVIWQQTIDELRQILKRLGIFRQFDIWGLQIELPLDNFALEWFLLKIYSQQSKNFTQKSFNLLRQLWLLAILSHQNEGIQLFRYDDPQMRPYSPRAINSQPGRETLILLVSDLVSPAWSRPEIYTLLQQWSSQGMVSLLQLLPERLWLRTVLGKQNRVTFNSPARLSHNQKLITFPNSRDRIISQDKKELYPQESKNSLKPPEFKIPITSLEPYHLEKWSKLLMGKGGNQSVGYKIQPSKNSSLNITHNIISPKERVKRFQTIASPTALKLAELLSAVLVTLPVIRVLQYTTLPQANQSHVAEVLMGGLFKPLEEQVTPYSDSDEIEFQFFPGVREELLNSLTHDEITFAIEEVSAYFAYKMGKTLQEFEALLMSSTYLNDELAKQIYPLARVQAQVLQQLGGEYAELANDITFAEFDLKTFSFEVATFTESSTKTELELTFVIATIEIQETRDFEFSVATLERKQGVLGIGGSWQINRQLKQGTAILENLGSNIELELVEVPGDSFIMGAPEDELESMDRERPLHEVNIPTFLMGRYPITQAQWRVVAGWEKVERELNPDPSRFQEDYEGIDRWTRPVENISWSDAKEFCDRLSRRTGKEYRLPTEAEWEYACRAETTTPFHFGETISTDLANYDGNGTYGKGAQGESRGQTTPVGYFKVANNFGLSDMHGNVWEWCEDDWHNSYEGAPTDGSAWRSQDSNLKVVRGGSWYYGPLFCRSAYRFFNTREARVNSFGFRVVCVAPRTT